MNAVTDQKVFKRTARTARKVNIDPKNYVHGKAENECCNRPESF
nr:MAG TPA: hypothetical protein [Microviridae sp.]